MGPTVLEICAGAGGQALGLEQARFSPVAAVELDPHACATLRANRPAWNVIRADVRTFDGKSFRGIDVLAGGVPCPPFSLAGRQLGAGDERDLFPAALRLVEESRPAAVMIENVRGLASSRFAAYRAQIARQLQRFGYDLDWRLLNACQHGVPQLRPRFVLVAMRPTYFRRFRWPVPGSPPPTVGEAVGDLMASREWPGAFAWRARAARIAPTIVGGSHKHGGPDLGPSRAKREWKAMGVDAMGVSDLPPSADFPVDGLPKLTVPMVARIQGFPDEWQFTGRKTAAYRQVGNAFPPPVARAVGESIAAALGVRTARRHGGERAWQLPLGYLDSARA